MTPTHANDATRADAGRAALRGASPTASTVRSCKCKAKKAVAASSLLRLSNGTKLPTLESYALDRVRIRYHWQEGGVTTCWVRVAQRLAGGGVGSQFLPRIGQEVVVQFIENDIDRPIIVGAVYNGQGEGGVAPTPGGETSSASSSNDGESLFKPAHDHGPSAQGNLAGGNSPVWHGASADDAGHRNAASQWGMRTKEFGGMGYNQLLFDDTDAQGRVQLRTG